MSGDNLIPLPGHRAPKPVDEKPAELPIIEPAIAPEFFSPDLARVQTHGPFTRLIWTSPNMPLERPFGDGPQNIVMCKIVVPTEALPAIYEAIGKAIEANAAMRS